MKIGIALGAPGRERAEWALRAANAGLAEGHRVELFLLLGGVGLFALADREPRVGRMLQAALSAGLELSACRACVLAHGARRSIRCETSALSHVVAMWRSSDRFLFISRFRRPPAATDKYPDDTASSAGAT